MNELIEYIKRWIKKADHDLGTAIITFTHIPKYKDTIAFHCQQAVEKYLKAYLLKLELPHSRTHDVVFLLEQINKHEKVEQEWFERALELQDFAVEIRYPDQIIELSDKEIRTAIETAKLFREMIIEKLQLDIPFVDLENNDDE